MARAIQLLTAATSVRPTAAATLERVSHFIKGRPEYWMRDTRDYQVLEPIVEIVNGKLNKEIPKRIKVIESHLWEKFLLLLFFYSN